MKRLVSPISSIVLFGALVAGISGCSLDRDGLKELQATKNGNAKLAAILVDTKRPSELRGDASALLFKKGAFKELMAAVHELKDDDRKYLVHVLSRHVLTYIEKKKYEKEKMMAFKFAYYLLEYADLLPKAQGKGKVKTTTLKHFVSEIVNESMALLKGQPNEIVQSDAIQKLLLASAIKQPELTLKEIYTFLNQTAPNLSSFLYVNHVLSALKRPDVKEKQAKLLLKWAKKSYPKVDAKLGDELFKNGNETLLRFLLDTARDTRVPGHVRGLGMEAAKILKQKALDGLFLTLKTDDPEYRNVVRFGALNLIWDYGGSKTLARALQSLPEKATWWPQETVFRERVGEFCEGSLKDDAAAVRPILENLLYDTNWVARVYAMECMIILYDDAVAALEPLRADDTVLKGWVEGGEITIGAYVQSLEEQ